MESTRDSAKNLEAQAIDSLFSQLVDWAKNNLGVALQSSADSILHMKPNGKRVMQVDENKIVFVKHATNASNNYIEFHLGFPFPCFSRIIKRETMGLHQEFTQYVVSVYLHQEPIHTLLRHLFVEHLKSLFPNSQHKPITFQDSKQLSKNIRAHYDAILFVDPFRFVGDSVMHLRNLDNVLSNITYSKLLKITSNRPCDGYADFKYVGFEKLANFIQLNIQASLSLIVVPNYIDDQWRVTDVVCQAVLGSNADATALILGRNILVENRADKSLVITDLGGKDFTIWNQPVYKNIDRACEIFTPKLSKHKSSNQPKSHVKVFINPFTSDPVKDIPAQLLIGLITHLAKLEVTELIIASGFSKMPNHAAYTRHIQNNIESSVTIEFYEYGKFSDMSRMIEACNLVISGDTSTAHLAHRHRVPSVVIYNRQNWDQQSWASLMHHSPFGFCSDSPWQIPMVIDAFDSLTSAEVAEMSHAIKEMSKALMGKQDKSFWKRVSGVYDKLQTTCRDQSYRIAYERLNEFWELERLSHWWVTEWFIPYEVELAILDRHNHPHQKALLLERFLQLCPLSKLAQINKEGFSNEK